MADTVGFDFSTGQAWARVPSGLGAVVIWMPMDENTLADHVAGSKTIGKYPHSGYPVIGK